MIRRLIALTLLAVPLAALADTYQVTVGWTDPTPAGPGYVPVYEMKYRVDYGAETAVTGLPVPGASVTVSATPGDPISVSVRAVNTFDGADLVSDWTDWVVATAPHTAVRPETQTGVSITVQRVGQ